MFKYTRALSLIVFVLIIGLSFVGCDDDGDESSQDARALTERDFFNNPDLFANPEEGVVVVFLEPGDAPEADNLTGGLGFDVIPHRYTRPLNHTYCFEDDNDESAHFMSLLNSDGEEVLRAPANGDCVTEVIEPGDYQMVLTHGEHVDQIDPVFLIPTIEDEQVAKRHSYVPVGFVRFFESINSFITPSAIAQFLPVTDPVTDTSDNVTTLISTNACVDCDLEDVDLTGNDLTFSDLTGADLSGANLSGIELFEALLTGANLSGADLSSADLRGTDLTSANLSNANLNNADLSSADLPFANLTGADITDADFSLADLTNATWIDGGTCDITSIGTCNVSSGTNPCSDVTIAGTSVVKCLLSETDSSVDLSDVLVVANTALSVFSTTVGVDTPMAIMAWGGEGGVGSNELITTGGDGGNGGFASTVTTLSDFQNSHGNTSLYYYLAQAGTLSNTDGDGGASTLVMLVESGPSSLDDMLLIAGGGAGGDSAGILNNGGDGGEGGIAASSIIGQGFIGVGQGIISGADGGSTDGDGLGGNGTNDGKDGIGGEGGQGFLGVNTSWLNGDPDVGSDGRGGNADDGFSSSGGGGGGGGYGGGGAGDGEPGAGGGSWSEVPTISCDGAPNNDSVPSSPGSIRDSFFDNSNGAVEIWIFADGC